MATNTLLRRLPAPERQRLLLQVEAIELVAGATLAEQGAPIHALLFPLSGCLSLQRWVDAHPPLQLGLMGRESCLGALLLLGPARHPLGVEVLSAGQALRLPMRALRPLLDQGTALRGQLAGVLRSQPQRLAQEALCCRFHALMARLARWLLERQDHEGSLRFPATHLTMARLLGVRREAVTSAACALQREGILRYHRGQLEICDPARLALKACSCHGARSDRPGAEGDPPPPDA